MQLSRRDVLRAGLLVGAPLAAPAAGTHLVATPAGRAQYLARMLDELCTTIGPRLAGTEAYERGARLIHKEMRQALPLVTYDTMKFPRWELREPAELSVDGRRLETYAAQQGPGTPGAGIRGVIRKSGGLYHVADAASGAALVNLTLGPFGPAVASSYRASDGLPRFSVGRQDVPLLDAAERGGLPVFARARVRVTPDRPTSNVVGTLPGESADEILYVAHADTVYQSPGASDNTASMITMLMLAHGFSGSRPQRTLTFVATTAEEDGSQGANHYARGRERAGTLGRVKICINLDSLTYGPNLQINTTDKALSGMLLDIHRDLGIQAEPKVFERDDVMDAAPFGAAGARTVHLNSRGHDARTLPLNHRPDDRADTIDPALVENSYRILMELTRRMDSMPL